MADVTVNTKGFDDGAFRYARAMDKTLRTWGFETERRAKRYSPVDTGFNANTIYTVTPDGRMQSNGREVSTRPGNPHGPSTKNPKRKYKPGEFAASAQGGGFTDSLGAIGGSRATVLMMGGTPQIGPDGTIGAPEGLQVEVRVGSAYALYLEVGTIHMQARPFLGRAAAEVTPMIDTLMRKNLRAEGLL